MILDIIEEKVIVEKTWLLIGKMKGRFFFFLICESASDTKGNLSIVTTEVTEALLKLLLRLSLSRLMGS